MTKEEKIKAIINTIIKCGKMNSTSHEIFINLNDDSIPHLYMSINEWSDIDETIVNNQYRILSVSVTNEEDETACWANYYDKILGSEEGYDIEYLSNEEIDHIYMIINIMTEVDSEKLKDLLDDCRKKLGSAKAMSKEYEAMKEGMDYVLKQWKTNKYWFKEESGQVTTEDVIKRVFQYAWNKRRDFN